MFFYGYDNQKMIFYVRDNIDYGKFSDFELYFDEVEESLDSMAKKLVDNITPIQELVIIESNPHNLFEFNMQYLYNELKTYLGINDYNINFIQNINTFESYKSLFEKIAYLNLDIYEFLINKVLNERPDGYEIKLFYLLFEHKKIMKGRIEYLITKGLIPYNPELIVVANEIFTSSQKLLNIIIKMNVKRYKDNIKLSNLISEVKQKEIVLINRLIIEINQVYEFEIN